MQIAFDTINGMLKLIRIAFLFTLASIMLFLVACNNQERELGQDSQEKDSLPQPLPSPSPTNANPPTPPPTATIDVNRRPDPSVSASAVTPDGAIWYAFDVFDSIGGSPPGSQNQGLYRLLDGRVSHFEMPHTIRVLEVAPDGALYIGAGCGVLRFQADNWETLLDPACDGQRPVTGLFPLNITFAADGALWVGGAFALARYDGDDWLAYDIPAVRLVPAPDGTIWAWGWDGRDGSNCCLAHISGRTWDTYTWSDEIPAEAEIIQALFDG